MEAPYIVGDNDHGRMIIIPPAFDKFRLLAMIKVTSRRGRAMGAEQATVALQELNLDTEVTAFIGWVLAGEISKDAIVEFVAKHDNRDSFLEQALLPEEKQALSHLYEHLIQTSLDENEVEEMIGVFAIQLFYRCPLHPFLTTRPASQRSQSPT
jgi:hypothetical protein